MYVYEKSMKKEPLVQNATQKALSAIPFSQLVFFIIDWSKQYFTRLPSHIILYFTQ